MVALANLGTTGGVSSWTSIPLTLEGCPAEMAVLSRDFAGPKFLGADRLSDLKGVQRSPFQ